MSKLANSEADVRHARRDLSADELPRLPDAARLSDRVFRGLTGTDRFALYVTAAGTGFRASELASMTPENFQLNTGMPVATVPAGHTKNRKEAVQPLPLDIAELLRGFISDKPANRPLWPGTWNKQASAKMIRGDLAEARAKWLSESPYARQRTEREQGDLLGLPRRRGALRRFSRLAAYVHLAVGQERCVTEGSSNAGPPFDGATDARALRSRRLV
jgi:hypothetical protein